MSDLQVFNFDSAAVRATVIDGKTWLVAADVCDVLGISDVRQALERLDPDERGGCSIPTAGGVQEVRAVNESGLYSLILRSRKPEARRFTKWVTSEVLPAIRKTGAYDPLAAKRTDAVLTGDGFDLMEKARRAAKVVLGLDDNAAAIAANNAVFKVLGVNALQLLGHTHLEAENQETRWYTPTELGKDLGLSGKAMNKALEAHGLQSKDAAGQWVPAVPAADGLYRLFDTGKRHSDGVAVTQLKWSRAAADVVQQQKAA